MVTLAYMAVNSRLHFIVLLMPLVMSLAAGKIVRRNSMRVDMPEVSALQ